MKNFIFFQSEINENPLENMDIICITRDNTPANKISDKMRELKKLEYKFFPVYILDHSGRTFKRTPFKDKWDSYLYGMFAIPKEYECTDTFLDDIYKEYGHWAEGEVYDVILLDGEGPSSNVFDYFVSEIDLYDLWEGKNAELMLYIKEKRLKYRNFENDLYDNLYKEFKSRYIGKTKAHGLIKKEVIEDKDYSLAYGIEQVEGIIEKV